MRWLICLWLLCGAANAAPVEAVREALAGWTQGAVKQDAAALARFLADDLQYGHAGGQLQTKPEYIKAVTVGPPRYESFGFEGIEVRIYGKTAVLTGFCDVKLIGRESFRVRTLQVYIETEGRWQMTAHQSTRFN